MSNKIVSEEQYVWADIEGTLQGQTIEPLYFTSKEDKAVLKLVKYCFCSSFDV